jgi:putative spermidine/putrescine transport system permease protein
MWVTIITLTYLWFPYMALPVFTAIGRSPTTFLTPQRIWAVVLHHHFPRCYPADCSRDYRRVRFTFSLSLGDYLAARFHRWRNANDRQRYCRQHQLEPASCGCVFDGADCFCGRVFDGARRTGSLERM